MPGLVVFRRRWSVGSDDLIVPGVFLLTIHLIWLLILSLSLLLFDYDTTITSIKFLWYYQLGYLGILIVSINIEFAICVVAMRGSILETSRRTTMTCWIYIRSVVILFDISWLILGLIWIRQYYFDCPIKEAKEIFLGLVISNWLVILIILTTIWCTFDAAGRSWVKMKKYQRSMRESESRFNYKRSGSMNRNWRQRKVIRAYQDSWDHRCRLLFCCLGSSDRNRNSFTDIARLLSDFFRELDVVPSDVVAGLVLLRKFQKLERQAIIRQRKNGTYDFLSGAAVTERTQFLALNDSKDYDFFQTVIHYMYYAQGAYGWPMYFIIHRVRGLCQLCPELRCCLSCCGTKDTADVINDNCCLCNYAALKKTLSISNIEIIYATYHVDIGETPFFVAIDYDQKKVVISIRGTLSMKDVLTDLNAEAEVLPLDPPREDWLGHKGMTQAAIYIQNKLEEHNLIQRALTHNPAKHTETFGLVCVGHSLGAGTASILAILLKPQYPTLQCFSYSPPGGLLSMPAVEYTKSFITSIVVGKDVVPRIGLHQMEALRADLINAIKRSVDPKWKTITCSAICCGCGPEPTSVVEMSSKDTHINQYKEQRDTARTTSAHPTDSSIALTFHQPLYPPGRIIHIVRHHPKPDEHKYERGWRQIITKPEPVYQAIWADTTDFDEVLISPVMFKDHMPDKVLAALKKVVTTFGPRKPQRQSSNAYVSLPTDNLDRSLEYYESQVNDNDPPPTLSAAVCNNLSTNRPQSPLSNSTVNSAIGTPTTAHKLCLETSFTNLQNQSDQQYANERPSSKSSSIAGSIFGRSQMSSLQHYDISSMGDDTTTTNRSVSCPSEATTILIADGVSTAHRTKNVAFDINPSNLCSTATLCKSPSPQVPPKSILHRQLPNRNSEKIKAPPTSFPQKIRRSSTDGSNKIDLIHDDWFGLAPLASPETLSEISSISSRTSAALSLANSIERYLQQIAVNETNLPLNQLNDIFESQMHTPKVMRRAPKFSENLSNCAEDSRAIDQYKRMGRIFLTSPHRVPFKKQDSDSSQDSFESASAASSLMHKLINEINNSSSKSADNIDNTIQNDNKTRKLTFSDSAILNECLGVCPQCPCKMLGGLNDCCRRTDHSGCLINSSTRTTASSCDTYYSARSSSGGPTTPHRISLQSSAKIPEENVTIHNSGIVETHFPAFLPNSVHNNNNTNNNNFESCDRQTLIQTNSPTRLIRNSSNGNHSPSHNYPVAIQRKSSLGRNLLKKRNSNEDRIFAKNESSLPLLAHLTETKSSPSFVKRKHYVYPVNSSPSKTFSKNESDV